MYMPTVARFTARDPLPEKEEPILMREMSKELQLLTQSYAYTMSNPLGAVDPTGLVPSCIGLLCLCAPDPDAKKGCSDLSKMTVRAKEKDKCPAGYTKTKTELYQLTPKKLLSTTYACWKCDGDCPQVKPTDPINICKGAKYKDDSGKAQNRYEEGEKCRCVKR